MYDFVLFSDPTPDQETPVHKHDNRMEVSNETATPTNTFTPEPVDISDTGSVGSIRRARRPPDLTLPSTDVSPDRNESVTVEPSKPANDVRGAVGNSSLALQTVDINPTLHSTPSRQSLSGGTGSISEKVSLVLKQHPCK